MNTKRLLTALAYFLMMVSVTFAQPYTSPQSGKRQLLVPSSYSTIQAAINASVAGDTVLVSPGVYNENIVFNGKLVMVASQYLMSGDTNQIIQTIIDGRDLGPVVTFEHGEGYSSLMVGFTIRNGTSPYGGGICCLSSSPVISNMIIKNNDSEFGAGIYLYESYAYIWRVAFVDNHSSGYGGAISCDYYSFPSIYNVTMTGNTALAGGGLHCYYSSPYMAYFEIYNCQANFGAGIYLYGSLPYIWEGKIYNNVATWYGGGIECDYYSEAYLTFLQINNNTAQYGAGIHLSESNVAIINSTIVSNAATYDGGGIYNYYSSPYLVNNIISFNGGQYGVYVYDGSPYIEYSDFWQNNTGNCFNCGTAIGTNVKKNVNNDSCDVFFNIKVDPLFVNLSQKNFNLQSTSHCIDAGHPDSPEDPDHSIVDIGKYNYKQSFVASFTADTTWGLPPLTVQFTDNSTGSPNQYQWDFQNDGIVDSYAKNPVYTYNQMGVYSVKLKIIKGSTNDVRIRPNFIKCTYTQQPVLQSVHDVPGDQGGKVTVTFLRSYYDETQTREKSEKYFIGINTGSGWIVADSVECTGLNEYTVICDTPFDSTATSPGVINFRVTAAMIEGDFESNEVQGYSVDNLVPQIPQELTAAISGQIFSLTWEEVPDPDVQYYAVYQSDENGIFGNEPMILIAHPPLQNLRVTTIPSMFAVCAVDSSGNAGILSEPVDSPLKQTISLNQGWNDISSYVIPVNPTLDVMFLPIAGQLIILQNFTGVYYPLQHQNTLGEWDAHNGYQIKLNAPVSFDVTGFEEKNNVSELNEGWNLVPVLCRCAVNTEEVADILGENLVLIREALGLNIFWPTQNVTSLSQLLPGRAYLIKMNGAGLLTLPECPE